MKAVVTVIKSFVYPFFKKEKEKAEWLYQALFSALICIILRGKSVFLFFALAVLRLVLVLVTALVGNLEIFNPLAVCFKNFN